MKAARFDYVRPSDVGQALAALAKAEGSAKVLAGGQSLGPMLNLRLARPSLLVDVSRLEILARLEEFGRTWRIGAGVTHSRIEDMRGQLVGGEMLCEVAASIAYRAIRNRGTIGGSVAHADPASDWPLALGALGATVNVRGIGGARAIPVAQFVLGAYTTVLRDDEISRRSRIPSSHARGVTAIISSVARPESLPKRARRRCSIQIPGPPASSRGGSSGACAACGAGTAYCPGGKIRRLRRSSRSGDRRSDERSRIQSNGAWRRLP